jgi:hypothetical protein
MTPTPTSKFFSALRTPRQVTQTHHFSSKQINQEKERNTIEHTAGQEKQEGKTISKNIDQVAQENTTKQQDSKKETTEPIINKLKRMNLKPPTRLNGTVTYKMSEELEKQWEKAPHLTVTIDDDLTEQYTQDLLDTALIFYFSANTPQFRIFAEWAEWAFEQQRGWRIQHIKYLGRNFFMVKFEKENDKGQAEAEIPWYMNRRYMYTFP